MAEQFSLGDFLPSGRRLVVISLTGSTGPRSWPTPTKLDLPRPMAARSSPASTPFWPTSGFRRRHPRSNFRQGSRKLARQVPELTPRCWRGVVNLTGLLTLGTAKGLKYFETGRPILSN